VTNHKFSFETCVVLCACNPSTGEAKAGGSRIPCQSGFNRIQGQPEMYSKNLSEKPKTKNKFSFEHIILRC
jgi:hypothetical protein